MKEWNTLTNGTNLSKSVKNISSQYSLITVVLTVLVSQITSYLISYIKSNSEKLPVDTNKFMLSVTKLTVSEILLAYFLTIIFSIIIYISLFSLNIINGKKFPKRFISYWFVTTMQFIVIGLFLSILLSVVVFILFIFDNYSLLVILLLFGVLLFLYSYYLKIRFKIETGVIVLLIMLAPTFFAVDTISKSLTTNYYLEFSKEIYTSKDNMVVAKIRGYHKVKNTKVTLGDQQIPVNVRNYANVNNTFLLIDLNSPYFTEGYYKLAAQIDDKQVNGTLCYVFEGNKEEREQYLDKFFIQMNNAVQNEKRNANFSKFYKELSDKLRLAYYKKDLTQIKNITIALYFLGKSDKLATAMSQLYIDPVVGFGENAEPLELDNRNLTDIQNLINETKKTMQSKQ